MTSETVPIDAIAHVVGQHGATLADLVTGFHRANLTVADSYTDPNRIGWLGYLPDAPRPASTTRTVGLNGEVTGSVTVEAGGVLYLDVNLAGTVEQDAVAGVRLVASGGGRAHLRAKVVRFTAHPHACDSWLADGVPMARDEGRAWATVPLSPSCSTATLVISHDHAQAYRIGEDEAASFQVSYEVSVREASDGPVDVGLVVDLSPSPEDEAAMLARQRAAAHAVVDALRPGDRAALITYDISGYVRVPLTEDTAAVHAAIDEAYDDASGWSYPNMSEGVSRAISELTSADQLDPRRGRAIVAFGDGGGWTTPSPFYLSRAASLGLPVHTVAWEPMYQGWQVEYISEATGGVFAVVDHEESPDAVLAQLLTWQRWYAAP